MPQPHILLTGSDGQLGLELQSALKGKAHVTAVTMFTPPVFDLAEPEGLGDKIRDIAPDIMINCAAYTAVDKAESEPELARLVNGTAPGIIAHTCAELDIPLVHYSTDYVFDGSKGSPYLENDPPCPINVYGESKLEGEQTIAAAGCRYYILRTSWVYAAHGHNFLNTMLRLAAERDALSIVHDQYGGPTWTGSLARETVRLVETLADGTEGPESGVYHLTCSGETTWHDFAVAIFEQAQRMALLDKTPDVSAVGSEQYPTPAKRPGYSVLNNSKAQQKLGAQTMTWQQGLENCLAAKTRMENG